MRTVLGLVVIVFGCSAAVAGSMTEVSLTGQPLQYTKEGAIDGCGIRLVGLPLPTGSEKAVPLLDVSFNVANPGGGLVKGGLTEIPMRAFRAQDLSKAVEVPIKNLWLKAPGGVATRPVNGTPMPTTTHKRALMYATQLGPVLDLITAMQDGQVIQIGFFVTKLDMERVYFGKIEITEAEMAQFAQCYEEWSTALLHRLKQSQQK